MTHHFKPFWNRWFHSSQENEVVSLESPPLLGNTREPYRPSKNQPFTLSRDKSFCWRFRNPKQPVDMVNIPSFTGDFIHPRLFGISEPSTVPKKKRTPFPSKSPLPPKLDSLAASAQVLASLRKVVLVTSQTLRTQAYIFSQYAENQWTSYGTLLFQIRFGVWGLLVNN